MQIVLVAVLTSLDEFNSQFWKCRAPKFSIQSAVAKMEPTDAPSLGCLLM